jgi:hypothetical protein
MDDQLYNLIEQGDLVKIQEYYNQKIFNSNDYKYIFFHASRFGHLEILKWISKVYPIILDPDPDPDSYFQFACVSKNYEKYFINACGLGHFEVAKWIFELVKNHDHCKINISANDDIAILRAFQGSHLDIVKFLAEINPKYKLIIQDDKIIDYKIIEN